MSDLTELDTPIDITEYVDISGSFNSSDIVIRQAVMLHHWCFICVRGVLGSGQSQLFKITKYRPSGTSAGMVLYANDTSSIRTADNGKVMATWINAAGECYTYCTSALEDYEYYVYIYPYVSR